MKKKKQNEDQQRQSAPAPKRFRSFNSLLTFIRLIYNKEIIRYDIIFIISNTNTPNKMNYSFSFISFDS